MKHFKFLYLLFLSIFLSFFPSSSKAVFILENGLGNWAVVSNFDNGTISVVDPNTGTSYGPFFNGILPDGDIFEIKVTPDGKKALVAAFYEEKVYFIDLTDPTNPSLMGSVETPGLYAENIAISPNGKCAVVGDGYNIDIDHLYIINIDSMTASPSSFTLPDITDVTISPDGSLVVASDYYGNIIRILSFDQTTCSISDTGNSYSVTTPNNSEFSKDGKTLIVVEAGNGKVKIFEVNGTTLTDKGEINTNCGNVQSVATYDNNAYVLCTGENPDKLTVLNITGPGQVSDSGTRIDLSVDAPTWAYFGVNQIAITPDGKYALVSSEAQNNFVSVVDLSTNTEVRTITTDNNSVSVATVPLSQPPHVDNGKMYGNYTIGSWPNVAYINSQIPCSDVGGAYTMFSMNFMKNFRYNTVIAYNKNSVICYNDPSVDPMKPVDFDTTIATLEGTMNYYTPVIVEIEESDGGEPGAGKDYVHITVIDKNTNNVIYEIDGMVTSGSVYATPLY